MSATYKQIYTKPSANDLWFFENDILHQYTSESNYVKNNNNRLTERFTGFISHEVETSITVEELELRKNELRPDLYYYIFELTFNDSADLSIITVIDFIKKYNIPIIINPYSTTHIETVKFDTWESLITAYSEIESSHFDNTKHNLTEYNNTLVEEFYIDDVKQDYLGVIGN
jgi:hypothetical protein